uniref:Eukaryotic translation initiation factor 3 subunit C n=1 Tax=Chelonoidis abingdonii TaxID=106734 RepID=A0A8C0HGP2_CHEAB
DVRFFTTHGCDSERRGCRPDPLLTVGVGGAGPDPALTVGVGRGPEGGLTGPRADPLRRRFEELTNLIKTIRNAMKIRDVTKCLEEFELLGKAYGKAKSIVDKEGVPRFYVRILADLEQYLNEVRGVLPHRPGWLGTMSSSLRAAGGSGSHPPLPSPRDEDKKSTEKKRDEKAKKKHDRKAKKYEDEEDEGGEWEKVKGGAPLVKVRPWASRPGGIPCGPGGLGRMGGDPPAAQIELLQLLVTIAAENNLGVAMDLKIKFNIVASLYDYNPNLATYMKPEMWKKCLDSIDELLDMLFANPNIFVGENILEESENLSNFEQPLRVRGCILTLVERMDEEFTKIMQNTDPHSQGEAGCAGSSGRCAEVLQEKGTTEENLLRQPANQREAGPPGDSKYGCAHGTGSAVHLRQGPHEPGSAPARILAHLRTYALHSRWFQASRPHAQCSNLQDNIAARRPPVQILYNRTMVQLGICAFRQGLIKDAHNALLDIQSSGRAKELLGQGLLMRSLQERNQEQEKVEKRRQVPFHMHINLELLECVYLVAAMLLEIPYMAAHEFDARRRMISKQFHHQLRVGERQPLLGPPESMREHVVAASKAMKMGDWRTCHRFIVNEKMNAKVWDLFPEADKVRTMLVRCVGPGPASLDQPTQTVVMHRMGQASLDQPTQTVVMHRTEPTALQNMALQLAEKLGNLVENNERVFDHKQGSYGGYFRDQKDGYRKSEGGYMRRGGYRQQERQANY